MRKHKYLLTILFLVFVGCSDSGNDQFQKRIPIDKSGNFSIGYIYNREKVKYLKLKSLEEGYDSIYFRIWYEFDNQSKIEVLEFYQDKGDLFHGKEYELALDTLNIKSKYPKEQNQKIPETGQDYYKIDTAQTMLKIINQRELDKPKLGWDSFKKELFATGISTATDWNNICDYEESPGGLSISIEISTKNYYRYIYYPRLLLTSENFSTKKIISAISVINKYFSSSIGASVPKDHL